jgi:hypothetical protein
VNDEPRWFRAIEAIVAAYCVCVILAFFGGLILHLAIGWPP